jgi:hypothetical protein
VVLAHLEMARLAARWLPWEELIVGADLNAAAGGPAIVVAKADQLRIFLTIVAPPLQCALTDR